MGFIVRLDHHGVTSMIRWLSVEGCLYTGLLSFFRASSWQLRVIQRKWQEIVLSQILLITIKGRYLIAGDGIKITKEAEKMPGVKRLHQESDNSGKAPYIYGHHFGAVGVLAGWVRKKIFCIPLSAELHEGVENLRKLQGKTAPVAKGKSKTSVTTLMALMVVELVSGIRQLRTVSSSIPYLCRKN